ncbi:hypothetical protein [Geobacter anodireducens]|uniref:hypothetical protein n=1 Tax=Geobacter soli TaxID=1510391 RepID=UPI0006918C41|nr:hypothetical protein [Geobacter soli]
MNDQKNLERAVTAACRLIQATWQKAVMGSQQIPGVPEIRANINLRRLYADSIAVAEQESYGAGLIVGRVVAASHIAKDLEYGKGPWDMKPMLLGGPKVKTGKNGSRYNTIPFRHGTSPKHAPNSNFKPMPKDIYAEARKLKASVRDGNRIVWGGKLTGTEERYAPGKTPSTGYQHKAGRFEGMVRIEKEYERATQSKYLTFRRVSSNSDPQAWVHPGYKAHHIARGVATHCEPAVRAIIEAAALQELKVTLSSGSA